MATRTSHFPSRYLLPFFLSTVLLMALGTLPSLSAAVPDRPDASTSINVTAPTLQANGGLLIMTASDVLFLDPAAPSVAYPTTKQVAQMLTTLQGQTASLASALVAESSRAVAVETSLTSALELATGALSQAQATLNTSITLAVSSAVASLNTNILVERSRALAIESMGYAGQASLGTSLILEVSRAVLAEGVLSVAVVVERSRAIGVESSLATQASASSVQLTTAFSTAVAAEMGRAVGVEGSLSLSLSSGVMMVSAAVGLERSRAVSGENSLGTQAALSQQAVSGAVAAEVVRATGVEGSLSLSLSSGVMMVSAAVGLERSRAIAVENSLGSQAALTSTQASTTVVSVQQTLSAAVAGEVVRAIGVESSLASQTSATAAQLGVALSNAVAAEVVRALGVEGSLSLSVSAGVFSVSSAVGLERSRAIAVENSLGTQAAQTAAQASTTVVSVQQTLSAAVAGEISRAISVDVSLSTQVSRVQATQASMAVSIVMPCPANSFGTAPSCTCDPGFSGTITAIPGGYSGTCTAVTCATAGGVGTTVAAGCRCPAGFSGSITPTTTGPNFFTSTCAAVACPANGVGTMPSCTCNTGYNGVGTVTATFTAPFFTSTCTPPARSCLQVYTLCPSCPSGVYTLFGSDSLPYQVYCLMDPASPYGPGWMMISQGGTICTNQVTSRTSMIVSGAPACGFLADGTIRLFAAQAAAVMIAVSTQASPALGAISTNVWSFTYTQSQAALVALRTGISWNGGTTAAFQGVGLPITWEGDSTYFFLASCAPGSGSGWPNMYHSCGNVNGVHWQNLGSTLHSKTSNANQFTSSVTWLR